MSTSKPAPPPYHHGDLRRALLDAAMDMLLRDGAAGLGLRELARVVGVSPAAPYRHFDSKASLLEALAVTGYQRFTKAMHAAGEGEGDRRNAMGQAYVRFALDNANLFRLMFSPELERSPRPALRMAADAAFATLRQVSEAEAEAQPRLAALRAWSQVHGLAVLLLDRQIALREGEDIDALVAGVLGSGPGQN